MSFSSSRASGFNPFSKISRIKFRPIAFLGLIILTALVAFEMFNFTTTEYALNDLLGNLKFAGILWSTILSIAFCGIDFAGIARLFTPEQGSDEPKEIWYLFGAWMLAATMNAILTWWGVSMAIVSHTEKSVAVMDPSTLTKVVPVFVAIMVWIIRILIIGSLSYAGDRLLWGNTRPSSYSSANRRSPSISAPVSVGGSLNSANVSARPVISTRPVVPVEASSGRPEPTYHSLSMNSRPVPRPNMNENSSNENRRM
ncbi:MAG: hypothetical protein P4L50_05745 [Anaerolineaceae bacterium]|nr:hypothetical protein [Anaerolineaceae bacterium]